MAYMLRKRIDGRLTRLEAVIQAGGTCDVMTDEQLTARLTNELWFLLVTGSLRINTAGQWCLPMLWGAPASHVSQDVVNRLNMPGPFRDFAEAVAASGDGSYTLTDDEGRRFTHELIAA